MARRLTLAPIPPSAATVAALAESAEKIVNYFAWNNPTWEFVGVSGKPGAQGGALLCREIVGVSVARHMIIKYFDSNDVDDALQEEMALRMVKGKEHMIRMIGDGIDNFGGGIGIILEYVGYGTLQDLFDRLLVRKANGHVFRVPERFLWSLFLCRKHP
ncbi:hypothetical protein F4820DRAFT_408431 [Hypoxylon rubiginosum]|uniref:Uncharacterized protein n=1 Tax=Hypoxylon rubiginosum TaxID=110542 RepID=A0ACB9ZB41_9PEZI|nr:hypothetical protein F4820DRAFT_408431 [Hypoxylon rubiginosum]